MVFSQLVIKNVLNSHGNVPIFSSEIINYIAGLTKDWRAWVGGTTLVAAAIIWYAAISRLPLSFAFPIGAMSYPLILFSTYIFLGETITIEKLIGNTLIVAGVLVIGLSNSS